MRAILVRVFCFLCMTPSLAAAADWQPIATALLKSEKTGFGGLCGIVVDHQTGDLWVNLSDRGMFHSSDQGKNWKRVSNAQPKGRTETPGCWLIDPTGRSKKMVTALVYGSPIAVSSDQAVTWKYLDNKSSHIDWCAVDWADPDMKFVLALKHESGGLLLVSRDGGKTFADVGKSYATGWIFDGRTAVVATAGSRDAPKGKLLRTTDAGKTFKPCGDYSPVGRTSSQALPKWHSGKLYWLVDGGLIVTDDQRRYLEENRRRQRRALRPHFRQRCQSSLRPGKSRRGGEHRWRYHLVEVDCHAQGHAQRRRRLDLAGVRPHPRHALSHENGHRSV